MSSELGKERISGDKSGAVGFSGQKSHQLSRGGKYGKDA